MLLNCEQTDRSLVQKVYNSHALIYYALIISASVSLLTFGLHPSN